jgi:thiol-disulfide isomerase/thioredoxin
MGINRIKSFRKSAMTLLIVLSGFPISLIPFNTLATTPDIQITIHLRSVFASDINLLPLSGKNALKSILEMKGIKNGETTRFSVPAAQLPGEFILRFDYKDKSESTPYPSEKHLIINDQDLELWVSPKYCNNPDSTWFQKSERENTLFAEFSKENSSKKEQVGILQSFLLNYDDTKSGFYQMGMKEYEKRRKEYNDWLAYKEEQDKSLFVSSFYRFQFLPQVDWKGTETERIKSITDHYFDGFDFNQPLIIKSSQLSKWMDNYVNIYARQAKSEAMLDTLLPQAACAAIEKAKKGHPSVYGWMVDYFYRGFESNSITRGMKVLEPYINDPNCLTTKKVEIIQRLKGMETLIPGSKAPDISMNDVDGKPFDLNTYESSGKYLLLVFWSADCSHCVETINNIYHWQQQNEIQQQIKVVDISLDETETEVAAWQKKVVELNGWKHLHPKGGVNSKVASDYYVLSTPVMILLDSKTKNIIELPNTIIELKEALNKK